MRFELRTSMSGHASTNPDGKMVAAREGPDVALEVRKEFHGDGVSGLWNKISLRHFQFVALQRPRFGRNLVACSRRQHEKISATPFAIDGVTRLRRARVHTKNMRLLYIAAGCFGAVQQ